MEARFHILNKKIAKFFELTLFTLVSLLFCHYIYVYMRVCVCLCIHLMYFVLDWCALTWVVALYAVSYHVACLHLHSHLVDMSALDSGFNVYDVANSLDVSQMYICNVRTLQSGLVTSFALILSCFHVAFVYVYAVHLFALLLLNLTIRSCCKLNLWPYESSLCTAFIHVVHVIT